MFDYTQCPSLQRSYIWQLHLLLQSVPDTTTIIFPFRRGKQNTNLSVTNMSVVLSGYLKLKDNQQSLSSFCLGTVTLNLLISCLQICIRFSLYCYLQFVVDKFFPYSRESNFQRELLREKNKILRFTFRYIDEYFKIL